MSESDKWGRWYENGGTKKLLKKPKSKARPKKPPFLYFVWFEGTYERPKLYGVHLTKKAAQAQIDGKAGNYTRDGLRIRRARAGILVHTMGDHYVVP